MKHLKFNSAGFFFAAALACTLAMPTYPLKVSAEEQEYLHESASGAETVPGEKNEEESEFPAVSTEKEMTAEEEAAPDEETAPDTETTADTEMPESGFSAADPVTGILAEAGAGVFPPGTMMIVTPLESGENFDRLAAFLSAAAEKFQVCDIRFFAASTPDFSDVREVQPQGAVKIRIPVPEGYELSEIVVYYIGTDGTASQKDFNLENGEILIDTEETGLYAVAEKKQIKAKLPSYLEMTDKVSRLELSGERETGREYVSYSEKAEYTSPATGDPTEIWGRFLCVPAAGGLCAAAAVYRRKMNSGEK